MIHYKNTVSFEKLQPQTLFAIVVADQLNQDKETWITSLSDGIHPAGPVHVDGFAVDLRTKTHSHPQEWFESIKKTLSKPQYTVLYESVGTDNEHIHIQYNRPPVTT